MFLIMACRNRIRLEDYCNYGCGYRGGFYTEPPFAYDRYIGYPPRHCHHDEIVLDVHIEIPSYYRY